MKKYGQRRHGCRVDEFFWRGHCLIVLENDLLRVGVLATKGADVIELRYKPQDLDVLWQAPQSLLPGEYVPTKAREQGSFLDFYTGGWQEIFPSAGPAIAVEGAALGQHGEVSLMPWDVAVVQDSARRVELEFSVETARTPFRLIRSMILELGSARLRIEESATNLGEQEAPYAWGHHPVFGPPFLEAGCRVETPDCQTTSMRGEVRHRDIIPAKDVRHEDVLVHSQLTEPRCSIVNPSRSLAVNLRWDAAAFPYLWMWQVFGGSWGYPYFGRAYCLGVEPFNCPPPRAGEAESALAGWPKLAPGGQARSWLELSLSRQP